MFRDPAGPNEVFVSPYRNLPQLNVIPELEDNRKVRILAPLILCGPSGTGKTTLLKRLMSDFEDLFGFSISHTTRKPRAGEQDGKDYYFVDREDMEIGMEEGEFIETAEFSGNLYGTSKKSVRDVQKQGKICILDVDIKGVYNLKKTDLNPRCIFIQPPNLKELEKRLRSRGTETEEKIKLRLARAVQEINIGSCKTTWHHKIVNDDLDNAYEQLKMYIKQSYTV